MVSALHALSFVAGTAAFLFVLLSLGEPFQAARECHHAPAHPFPLRASASGLLYVAEVIEEHAGLAKTVGQRTIYVGSSPTARQLGVLSRVRRVASFPSLLEKILRANPLAWGVRVTFGWARCRSAELWPERMLEGQGVLESEGWEAEQLLKATRGADASRYTSAARVELVLMYFNSQQAIIVLLLVFHFVDGLPLCDEALLLTSSAGS